jgi:hypothetical protein
MLLSEKGEKRDEAISLVLSFIWIGSLKFEEDSDWAQSGFCVLYGHPNQ